jgi:hypothetical protein
MQWGIFAIFAVLGQWSVLRFMQELFGG